jgi:hypothetical protein
MTQVLIRNGVYRNKPVHNEVFELVKDFTAGAKGGFGSFLAHLIRRRLGQRSQVPQSV